MKGNDSFKKAITEYLQGRASCDEQFAKKFVNKEKSIDKCCDYIIGEAKKRGNAVAMTEAEVFGLAIHYYDESEIVVKKLEETEVKVTVPNHVKDYEDKELQQVQRKPVKKNRKLIEEEFEKRQLSLF